jgi:NitT/TauT family transport system substrate-binding protein
LRIRKNPQHRPRPLKEAGTLFTFRSLFTILAALVFLCPSCKPAGQGRTTVRLAYLQSDLHHLPAFVALERGFYREEGLTVEIAGVFKAGPELMSGFSSGSLDAGYVGLAPALVAAANGTARIALIAQVNKNGSALVVGKDSPVSRPAELKGTVIAIPGHATIQDFLLRRVLGDAGIGDNGATIITIKPPEMISVLSGGQIAAFMAWEPYPSLAVTNDAGRVLSYSQDIWPDHPCCVLAVSTAFLEKHTAEVNALRRAHRKSIDYIENNPVESVSIGVKYTAMDPAVVTLALGHIQFDEQLSSSRVLDYALTLNKLGYTGIGDPPSFLQSLLHTSP